MGTVGILGNLGEGRGARPVRLEKMAAGVDKWAGKELPEPMT